MRIVHVSSYEVDGGAARACHRLHMGLLKLGYESMMFVKHRSSKDASVIGFKPSMDVTSRGLRWLRGSRINRSFAAYQSSLPPDHEGFTEDRCRYGLEPISQIPTADIVNIHWVKDLVDYRSFLSIIPQRSAVVWTLHDMNIFTGGCHYDGGCGGFVDMCGSCPQLGSGREFDLSRQAWQRKQEVFGTLGQHQLHIVADSHWLANKAGKSSLLKRFPVVPIHYGLDLECFAPRDRECARAVLGVPSEALVVLFGADWMAARRKGFHLLRKAVGRIESFPNLYLLSVGQGELSVSDSIPHRHLGYVRDDRYLSLVYSAADVFVIPSLQEAFGQTALEAMACGTPVVGFATGGIPEIIRHGSTGLLVSTGNVEGLASAITNLLGDSEMRAKMAATARALAVAEFSLEAQARNYAELYRSILGSHRHCL